jgi:hypothetical protein
MIRLIFIAMVASSTPVFADPITVPNASFEEREVFDTFPEGTDKYNQWLRETWRHFELGANGGPLRIWNPGVPGVDDTAQGIADVAFGGDAPEGDYIVVVRSRENDPARTFEAAVQILDEPFDSSQAYTLTVQVGKLPETDSGGSGNYDPDWFGYAVQFAVGGENVDGATFAGQVTGGVVLAEDRDSQDVPVDSFVTSTVIYRPDPADAVHDGEPIQIRLCALETPENPEDDSLAGWVAFDDVTLETGAVAAPAFEITSFALTPAGQLTLTWDSKPGESYAVSFSTDLVNWDGDLDDGVDADEGESTTRDFNVAALVAEDESLYFRIERN